ncbi:hypothetical protein JTB14_028322 [Gonioctena quinquepunctata]|nr:hypothetical protein JTB14_028322 [Gonioctena quinquepunctata]
MEYSCIVYGSARRSRLKMLETIQCTALRFKLGAFQTSLHASPYAKASIPPLNIRRNQLLANYCTGIWAQPNHPNYPPHYEEENVRYEIRPTITRPAVRLKECPDSIQCFPPSVLSVGPNAIHRGKSPP